jgi:hypothetical protein
MSDTRSNHQRRIDGMHRALHDATEVLNGMHLAIEAMPSLDENVYWLSTYDDAVERRQRILRRMELALDAAASDGFSQRDFAW